MTEHVGHVTACGDQVMEHVGHVTACGDQVTEHVGRDYTDTIKMTEDHMIACDSVEFWF